MPPVCWPFRPEQHYRRVISGLYIELEEETG